MARAWRLGVVAIVGLATHAGVVAQYSCGQMNDGCGMLGLGHTTPGPYAEYRYPHTACEYCQIGDEYYEGSYCHGPCGHNLMDPVLDAAHRMDAAAVQAMAAEMHDRIYMNTERNSMQLLDCSGSVIANVPFDHPGRAVAEVGRAAVRHLHRSLFELVASS